MAVIPESDETAIQLTTEIQRLKEALDKDSLSLTQLKVDHTDIKSKRADTFLKFFNQVATTMPKVYREMTGGIGSSSLLIAD